MRSYVGDEGILEYHAVYEEGKTIVTNSLGHTTVYEYDHRKLITQITSPKGEITIFRYDDNEDQVLVLDPMAMPIGMSTTPIAI